MGDARLAFWFAPWHSIPGTPIDEQMERALLEAQSCAVFISGGADGVRDSPAAAGDPQRGGHDVTAHQIAAELIAMWSVLSAMIISQTASHTGRSLW